MSETTPPVVVNPSAVPAVAGTLIRDLVVILAAIPIVVRLIGARDLRGLLDWMQSSDGALVVTIVAPLIASGWRAWRAKRKKAELVTVARAAPDSVAIVTAPTPPPAAA